MLIAYGYKPEHQLFQTHFLQNYIKLRAHGTKLNFVFVLRLCSVGYGWMTLEYW